jgi:hypothetical protein
MFSDPPLTKRQLGWLLLGGGSLLILVSLGADLIGAGQFNGLGPAQKQAIAAGMGLCVLGLTFLPFGHRPA